MLPYGYAVKRGDAAWLATVEAFVARIKAQMAACSVRPPRTA